MGLEPTSVMSWRRLADLVHGRSHFVATATVSGGLHGTPLRSRYIEGRHLAALGSADLDQEPRRTTNAATTFLAADKKIAWRQKTRGPLKFEDSPQPKD